MLLNLRSWFLAQYLPRNHNHISFCLLYISTWMFQRYLMLIGSKIKLVLSPSQPPLLLCSLSQPLEPSFIHHPGWNPGRRPWPLFRFSLTLAIRLSSSNQSFGSAPFASSMLSLYLLPLSLDTNFLMGQWFKARALALRKVTTLVAKAGACSR